MKNDRHQDAVEVEGIFMAFVDVFLHLHPQSLIIVQKLRNHFVLKPSLISNTVRTYHVHKNSCFAPDLRVPKVLIM